MPQNCWKTLGKVGGLSFPQDKNKVVAVLTKSGGFRWFLYSAGESVDISDGDTESVALTESSGQTLREKMVYMSVGDSHHNQGNHGGSSNERG